MTNVEKLFAFSFGGNNNFGEIISIGESVSIDFPKEHPEGYGFALRMGIDTPEEEIFTNGEIDIEFTKFLKEPIIVTLEFKIPGGVIADTSKLQISSQKGIYKFHIPEKFGELSEIVFFISRRKNPNLITSMTIQNLKLS